MSSASAPGRVNLIGEHTDYNGGFVLPVALPLRVTVDLEPRADRVVRVSSTTVDDGRWHDVPLGVERTETWIDHVIGAGRVVGVAQGYEVRITSDIPMGAGLGSSGALGVALLRAIRSAFGIQLDDVALARLAQRSENEFVGASSGIMDQMAASLGREGEALFLDCRSLEFERIELPELAGLLVIHSGVMHRHSAGTYNERRRQCEEAARALDVGQLRDLSSADLPRIETLPEPLRRRARHVVSEDARVLAAVRALRDLDLEELGRLLDASHRSLRDDYEVSTPEVDLLVDLVREQPGVLGARITGGGFGGSIVAIAELDAAHHAGALAVAEYEQRTGRDARILLPPLTPDTIAPS